MALAENLLADFAHALQRTGLNAFGDIDQTVLLLSEMRLQCIQSLAHILRRRRKNQQVRIRNGFCNIRLGTQFFREFHAFEKLIVAGRVDRVDIFFERSPEGHIMFVPKQDQGKRSSPCAVAENRCF